MTYWTGKAIEVGVVEQLLIDDHIVEDAWDVKRRVCQPLRHPASPVMYSDKPWEKNIIPWRVIHDPIDNIYRMYYQSMSVLAWQYQFLPALRGR